MTFWGTPPVGGKWYAGSSADTAVNHDILWKERVKSELDLIQDEDFLGQSVGSKRPSTARGRMQGRNGKHGHGEGGFVHRPWDAAEVNRLRTAVQKHGVGAWDSMRHDSAFSETLGAHTASALSNKWKKVEARAPEQPSNHVAIAPLPFILPAVRARCVGHSASHVC